MSSKYKAREDAIPHFVTFTVVGWIDVFSRQRYRDIVIESLRYCQKEKGLTLHAYVIMTNHIHIVASPKTGFNLVDIVRDFKKFTAKTIWESIDKEPESRREWLQYMFKYFAKYNTKDQVYQIWTHDNHPIELWSQAVIAQKINYIHQSNRFTFVNQFNIYFNRNINLKNLLDVWLTNDFVNLSQFKIL